MGKQKGVDLVENYFQCIKIWLVIKQAIEQQNFVIYINTVIGCNFCLTLHFILWIRSYFNAKRSIHAILLFYSPVFDRKIPILRNNKKNSVSLSESPSFI